MIPLFNRKILRLTSLAFIIPSSMVIGYGLGYLVDRVFSTTWGKTAGLILGIIAGFYELIRQIVEYNRELDGKGN